VSSGGRPELEIGKLGSVAITVRGDRWQARGRTRTAGGELKRIAFTGVDEESARAGLAALARKLGLVVDEIREETTLGGLLDLWIKEKRRSGRILERSAKTYDRHILYLKAAGGALALQELRPGRVQELIDAIRDERSLAAAHKCSSILRGAFALAVRRNALTQTPMSVLEPLPPVKGPGTSLTVEQVGALRAAILRREARIRKEFGLHSPNLRLVVEVLLASGLRISEALALRHQDVDLEAGSINVFRTLVVAPGGVEIEERLKRTGQERIIDLPPFAVQALREARSNCETVQARLPDAPAIQSLAGTWCLPYNIRRGLRSLRGDEELKAALAVTGLTPADITPHLFRRTTASLLAQHDGRASAAQELLGHSNESTTKSSYISGPFRRVTAAAPTLEELLGGGRVAAND